jgi:hypothetical protein
MYCRITVTMQPGGSASQYTLSTCLYPQSTGLCKGKGKVVFLHTIKVRRGSRSKAPPIVSLGTRWRRVVNFKLWLIYRGVKNFEYLLNRTSGWAPEFVWTFIFFWRGGKYLAGNGTPDHPAYVSTYAFCSQIFWTYVLFLIQSKKLETDIKQQAKL